MRMKLERRHATRPNMPSDRDFMLASAGTFIVGAMLGAVITLAWML